MAFSNRNASLSLYGFNTFLQWEFHPFYVKPAVFVGPPRTFQDNTVLFSAAQDTQEDKFGFFRASFLREMNGVATFFSREATKECFLQSDLRP